MEAAVSSETEDLSTRFPSETVNSDQFLSTSQQEKVNRTKIQISNSNKFYWHECLSYIIAKTTLHIIELLYFTQVN